MIKSSSQLQLSCSWLRCWWLVWVGGSRAGHHLGGGWLCKAVMSSSGQLHNHQIGSRMWILKFKCKLQGKSFKRAPASLRKNRVRDEGWFSECLGGVSILWLRETILYLVVSLIQVGKGSRNLVCVHVTLFLLCFCCVFLKAGKKVWLRKGP